MLKKELIAIPLWSSEEIDRYDLGKALSNPQLPRDIAKSNNWDIVYPAGNQLLIDIDSEENLDLFYRRLEWFKDYYFTYCGSSDKDILVEETPSMSNKNGHRHVKVTIIGYRDLSVPERIALQACLGSDLKREMLSILSYLKGIPSPTLFFEAQK